MIGWNMVLIQSLVGDEGWFRIWIENANDDGDDPIVDTDRGLMGMLILFIYLSLADDT